MSHVSFTMLLTIIETIFCVLIKFYGVFLIVNILIHSTYTRPFIMYSVITKIYYKKTVGHVFTKPVQIEGTTQIFFPPSKLFFIVVHISAARRCECM
jgi:hypothetical protein